MVKKRKYEEGGTVKDPLARAVNRVTPSGGRPYSTFLQEPRLGEFAPKASRARQQADFDATSARADEDTKAMRSDMEKAAKQRYCKGGKVISVKNF